MRSLQHRLTLGIASALTALLMLAGLLAYPAMRTFLKNEFDHALLSRARQLTVPVEDTTDLGQRISKETAPGSPGPHAEYFELRTAEGEILSRSPGLGGHAWTLRKQAHSGPAFFNVKLPGGRSGRAVALRLTDRAAPAGGAGLLFVLAHDAAHLEESQNLMLALFAGGVVVLIGLAIGLVHLATRRGLRPFTTLAGQLAVIRSDRLGTRIDAAGWPAELVPIVEQLNRLLVRLEDSFEGERRFSANAAHELLTPVSELRAAAENALQWRDDPAATGRLAEDTLESANQMERLVRTLLLLARNERGSTKVERTAFDLVPLLREGLESVADRLTARSLQLKTTLPESATIVGEPAACTSMIQNLLQNAVEYAPEGAAIECRLEPAGSGVRLVVANTNPGLDQAALARIWDPFWRRDPARSDRAHAGLGLSLVRALARVQGFEIEARLPTRDLFQMEMSMPTPTPATPG